MKKSLSAILVLFLSFTIHAQSTFEKGYFISNNDVKTECLIKNLDWRNNPTEFEYRLEEGQNSSKQNIDNIKEFGIDAISKYKRFTVKLDTSSIRLDQLSSLRQPQFKEVTIFLKTLIEGKANLYLYEDGNSKKYFYNYDLQNVEQLIHKQFIRPQNKIGVNNLYKQQLYTSLQCDGILMESIHQMDYEKKDLIEFFKRYNDCQNSEIINYNTTLEKRDLFNVRIRPGITYSSLDITNLLRTQKTIYFDNEIGYRLGIEIEGVLPFNNSKWSIFVEPTYQYYKTDTESSSGLSEVDYKSIEIPIGVRHCLFLKNKSKIFLSGAYIFDLPMTKVIDFEKAQGLEINTVNNLLFGVGYDYQNKFNIELRYGLSREVLNFYKTWSSNYKSASLVFGYTLF